MGRGCQWQVGKQAWPRGGIPCDSPAPIPASLFAVAQTQVLPFPALELGEWVAEGAPGCLLGCDLTLSCTWLSPRQTHRWGVPSAFCPAGMRLRFRYRIHLPSVWAVFSAQWLSTSVDSENSEWSEVKRQHRRRAGYRGEAGVPRGVLRALVSMDKQAMF